MFRSCQTRVRAAAFGLLAAAAVCPAAAQTPGTAEMEARLADLAAENSTLRTALVQANKEARESREQLAQVRLQLAALGKDLLAGGNERLVQAAADIEVTREHSSRLEQAAMNLVSAVGEYSRTAVASDPDSRLRLESAVRELDTLLGSRHKPRAEVRVGMLQKAELVSVDSASGMVILNIGENQGARIGMSFDLYRAQQSYGKAVVADVRKAVAGAFIEQLDKSVSAPRPGDTAVLSISNRSQQ